MIRQDLRHAVRILAANPGFTAVAVLSLALGIGANTAIFSLVNSVLMSTLPVRNPHELVMLTDPLTSGVSMGMEGGERSLVDIHRVPRAAGAQPHARIADGVAKQSSANRGPRGGRAARGDPHPHGLGVLLQHARRSGACSAGRSHAAAGAGGRDRAICGHQPRVLAAPLRRASTTLLGRTIALGDGVLSVIGVMPASFFGETVGERPDAWIPLAMQATVLPGRDWLHDQPGSVEKVMWLHLFGRLRPDVSLERAQADTNVIFQQGLAAYYGSMADADTRKRFLDQRLRLKPAATGASSLRGDFSEPLLRAARRRGTGPADRVFEPRQPRSSPVPRRGSARWRCGWRLARAAVAWSGS